MEFNKNELKDITLVSRVGRGESYELTDEKSEGLGRRPSCGLGKGQANSKCSND